MLDYEKRLRNELVILGLKLGLHSEKKWSNKKIAKLFGWSVEEVRQTYARAVRRVRQYMRAWDDRVKLC